MVEAVDTCRWVLHDHGIVQRVFCGGVGLCLSLLVVQPSLGQDIRLGAPIPHERGQSVTASYEGWYRNTDGTRTLVFGYFNRNYQEELTIPVGPENRFEPGPTHRGQPTHFLPRRHTGVFGVTVPADFGEARLIWSLTSYGETIVIPGHLEPGWEITALEEVTSGNTPPVVRFQGADGAAGQGPFGVRAARVTAEAGVPTPIRVWASDDGVRKARSADRPPRFGLVWSKYRGPGGVTFSSTTPEVDADARAETMVTFDAPGEYVLRVLAWDDSGGQAAIMAGGFFCCWTNGFVPVTVQ